MNILIVGAGGIGTTYGAYLSRASSVTFLGRRMDQVEAISKLGGVHVLDSADKAEFYPATAIVAVTDNDHFDLILFTTKLYDLPVALQSVKHAIKKDTILMAIQNGVQHFDMLQAAYPENPCLGAVSYSGLTKLNNTDVRNTGKIQTIIGDNAGEISGILQQVKELFEKADMPIQITVPIKKALWEKQVLTSMQQGIGALTGFTFAQLNGSEPCRFFARQLYEEVVVVANAEGVEFAPDTYEKVLKNWANKPAHRPSMAVDFDKGNPLEIHMANGIISEIAEKHGLSAPVNKAMYHIIRAVEESRKVQKDKTEQAA